MGDRNPGSVRGNGVYPVAYDGYTVYPSYAAAVTEWFNLLNNRYVGQGATTVYSISGPYVGTSGSGNWAYKVINLMARYRNEAPPPDPTTQPTQTPKAQPTPQTRSYIPIGNEQNWEQLANAKRHQLWLNKNEGNNNTGARPQIATISNTRDGTTASAQAAEQSTQPQPLLIGIIMLLAIILAGVGLTIRRRQTVIVPAAGVSAWTRTSLAAVRFPTTEKLAPVAPTPMLAEIGVIPPTPMLAGIGAVPLTPYMPAYNEAPAYPQYKTNQFQPHTSSTRIARPTRLVKASGINTEQLQPITIGKKTAATGSDTEALKPIQTGITLPNRVPVKAGNRAGGLLTRFGNGTENH
ncbi:hypothetical protein [Dictyobacter kobayashii]|uniref:Mannosyl-glycoprotein endo-beta-N-acetylglucosamidase-like domain-containing protein n=1 Tax=Dictyobacter kobayashii TaxID=2014872 RepID=A0A402AHC0_9CHLR|nr:hypothetical protein [Dictyobacter kobayashii]GCE18489.1 hypothetical protein KDK_22890 [Dictyobacter kobayashii]